MIDVETGTITEEFEERGLVVVPGVTSEEECDALASRISSLTQQGASSRLLLTHLWCAELAGRLRRIAILQRLLSADAVCVQCTLFDKSVNKNWLVSLHQDLSIPVGRRVDNTECSGWSEKEGQVYVQPPVGVLGHLVVIRGACGSVHSRQRSVAGCPWVACMELERRVKED
jgi:hypothetical protein